MGKGRIKVDMKAMTTLSARKRASNDLSPVGLVAMMMVGRDRLHFGKEKMWKLALAIEYQYDSVNKKYIFFTDLKEALEDEGIKVPYTLDLQESHSTRDERKIVEYVLKGYCCMVLATVLQDKFGFGKVKTQQSINQFEQIYEEIKDGKWKEESKRLVDENQIQIYNRRRMYN